MRFIDSNIFIQAWLKPKRELSEKEIIIKKNSKKILKRVENGEEVATTIIHISEIANILEAKLGVKESLEYIEAILGTETIKVLEVEYHDLIEAIEISRRLNIGLMDSIAYVLMIKHGINEIYTMDKDFKKVPIATIEE